MRTYTFVGELVVCHNLCKSRCYTSGRASACVFVGKLVQSNSFGIQQGFYHNFCCERFLQRLSDYFKRIFKLLQKRIQHRRKVILLEFTFGRITHNRKFTVALCYDCKSIFYILKCENLRSFIRRRLVALLQNRSFYSFSRCKLRSISFEKCFCKMLCVFEIRCFSKKLAIYQSNDKE